MNNSNISLRGVFQKPALFFKYLFIASFFIYSGDSVSATVLGSAQALECRFVSSHSGAATRSQIFTFGHPDVAYDPTLTGDAKEIHAGHMANVGGGALEFIEYLKLRQGMAPPLSQSGSGAILEIGPFLNPLIRSSWVGESPVVVWEKDLGSLQLLNQRKDRPKKLVPIHVDLNQISYSKWREFLDFNAVKVKAIGPNSSNGFGLILASSVFNYLDFRTVLSNLVSSLAPGGWLVAINTLRGDKHLMTPVGVRPGWVGQMIEYLVINHFKEMSPLVANYRWFTSSHYGGGVETIGFKKEPLAKEGEDAYFAFRNMQRVFGSERDGIDPEFLIKNPTLVNSRGRLSQTYFQDALSEPPYFDLELKASVKAIDDLNESYPNTDPESLPESFFKHDPKIGKANIAFRSNGNYFPYLFFKALTGGRVLDGDLKHYLEGAHLPILEREIFFKAIPIKNLDKRRKFLVRELTALYKKMGHKIGEISFGN